MGGGDRGARSSFSMKYVVLTIMAGTELLVFIRCFHGTAMEKRRRVMSKGEMQRICVSISLIHV